MINNFHSIGGLTAQENKDARTRVFVGLGTAFLLVAGLVQVESVRIDGQEIPLFEDRSYPLDGSLTRFETVREEIIGKTEHPETGVPILLRSKLSNDGIWQKDSQIHVTGEWADDDAPAAKAPKAPAAKAATPDKVETEDGDTTPSLQKVLGPNVAAKLRAAGIETLAQAGTKSDVELRALEIPEVSIGKIRIALEPVDA